MSLLNVLAIAVGLAMDAFAVSIAVGLTLPAITRRHVFRLAWHFGLFQFLMPVIGWLAGRTVATHIAAWDHWLAFGLLALIGGRMIRDALAGSDEAQQGDPTRGITLITLSVATSVDALAVGLSLAFLNVSIWMPSVIIGLVAGTLTTLGMLGGHRLGAAWGKRSAIGGGVVLIGIGLRILVTHLAT